jgi:hypothetical protein
VRSSGDDYLPDSEHSIDCDTSGGASEDISDNTKCRGEAADEGEFETATDGDTNEHPRRSRRSRRPPGEWWATCALIANTTDPTTVSQALGRPDAAHWTESMESEYDSLHRHKTWTLVPRPADRKVIPCTWVFKQKVIKSDTGADALKYKSRLVANKEEFWGLISDLFIFGRSHHSVPAYLPHFLFEVLTVKRSSATTAAAW